MIQKKAVRYRLMLCQLLCLLLLAGATQAQNTPTLQAQSFTPQAATLTSQQRQQLYLQLIENFVGWAEQSGRFTQTDLLEPGGGYFDAAGSGVTWARGNSNLCIAYAVLLDAYPERERFSIHNIPRRQLETHLRHTIRAVCLSNKNCSRHRPSSRNWGGPAWQSALELIGCAWAAKLLGEQLDTDTQALVREVVCAEADHLDKAIPSRRFDNTGAEDCCWNTPLLALAACQYPDDARAATWDRLGKKWAYNGVSIGPDAESSQLLDGQPLRGWIVSENLHPDLTLENHGMWSVGYQVSQQHFGEAVLAYQLSGRQVPDALAHHADQMWRDVVSSLCLWDGDLLYPHGQDWSWKVYSSCEYLCWLNCCRGNAQAGAYESRGLQMIYQRQRAIGTGDLGAAYSRPLDFGNQTVKPKRWAFCYLMHKHVGGPEPIPLAQAARAADGVHVFPFTKVAIHRTPQKCVSVSWHPRHQPIFVLPEGDSTFENPPFFFPYDRHSGCAQVRPAVRARSLHNNPRHPAALVADGDLATFWITGSGGSQPGDGPTKDQPDWIQLEYPQPRTVSSLVLCPRERYGPRELELQVAVDGQEEFRTVARFTASHHAQQTFAFPETTGQRFRIVIHWAHDPRYPEQARNAQIREIELPPANTEPAESAPSDFAQPIDQLVLDEATATQDGQAMRVRYRLPQTSGITQYVQVISLPGEATVYATAFRAAQATEVEVSPLFPLRTGAPRVSSALSNRFAARAG